MKLVIFGSTGALGGELLQQSLVAGHDVTVLVRDAAKLPNGLPDTVSVVAGNALDAAAVQRALANDPDAVLFAIGVDKASPQNLCTDVTRHILDCGVRRFIWCGGGSNLLPDDEITFGAKFVEGFSELFLSLRHNDKKSQLALLDEYPDVNWYGVRPLQMNVGPLTTSYRLGYNAFSGMSKISFADCAHAMMGMLEDDTWLRKAPIVQY